jgi:predicted nuclease of restriction endonuclease-like (RecB) superfamily
MSGRSKGRQELAETGYPLSARDPVILEFLGLPGVGKLLEADLERALLDNLQAFPTRTGQGIRVCRETVSDQFRVQRFLHRPGFLQLSAQVLRAVRSQVW